MLARARRASDGVRSTSRWAAAVMRWRSRGMDFTTFGVDVKHDAVRDAVAAAAQAGLRVRGWCADLTMYPLPVEAFDLVVVTRYLQRNLFAVDSARGEAGRLRPLRNVHGRAARCSASGPTSPDHLLEPGELRREFDGWDVLFYDEVAAPEAVARLAAQRSFST